LGISAIWTSSGLAYIALANSIWGGCVDISGACKDIPNAHLASLFEDDRVDIISSHPESTVLSLYDSLQIKTRSFYKVDGHVIPRKGIREVYEEHAAKSP
jgi:hypothetical protein